MKLAFGKWLGVFTFMVSGFFPAPAQEKYPREIKGRQLVKFDWNCTSPSALAKSSLKQLIERALQDENTGTIYYADRAFTHDLNADGRLEYFVPLSCGATGNCTFGLFNLSPDRFLGKINGQFLYFPARPNGWPEVITYAHFTAVEGDVFTYRFSRGRYRALKGHLHTDSRGGIYGKKAPAFLDRAQNGCAEVGG